MTIFEKMTIDELKAAIIELKVRHKPVAHYQYRLTTLVHRAMARSRRRREKAARAS